MSVTNDSWGSTSGHAYGCPCSACSMSAPVAGINPVGGIAVGQTVYRATNRGYGAAIDPAAITQLVSAGAGLAESIAQTAQQAHADKVAAQQTIAQQAVAARAARASAAQTAAQAKLVAAQAAATPAGSVGVPTWVYAVGALAVVATGAAVILTRKPAPVRKNPSRRRRSGRR